MFAFITISSDPSACNPSGTQLFMSNPNVIPTLKLHYKRIAIFPQWVLPYPVARQRSRSCYQIESPLLVALLIYHSLNFNHVIHTWGWYWLVLYSYSSRQSTSAFPVKYLFLVITETNPNYPDYGRSLDQYRLQYVHFEGVILVTHLLRH